MSYISRACSSLVRQPYYIPNRFILKIRGLVVVLTVRKVHWAGRAFYMDEYTLIFLFSRCIRCAQKRDCWESVRFASERSRVRIPLGPPICRIVLYDAAFFMPKTFGRPCRVPNPEVGCEPRRISGRCTGDGKSSSRRIRLAQPGPDALYYS